MKKLLFVMGAAAIMFASCTKPSTENGDNNGGNEPEPEPVVVTDLNADGETANCYMIHKAGTYCFDATVMGNGATGLKPSMGITSTTIAPTGAELIWSEVDKLVSDVKFDEGKITFTVGKGDGNALIGATDDAGKVLWSWHIWCTEEPAIITRHYDYNYADGSYVDDWFVMDRNLGAYSENVADGEDAYGLYYQWGRKDPFSYFRMDQSLAEGKFHPTAGTQDKEDAANSIAYSIEHPETFLIGYQYGTDPDQRSWIYSVDADAQKAYNDLWGAEIAWPYFNNYNEYKTIFDPCPAGYTIAVAEFYDYSSGQYKDGTFADKIGDDWKQNEDGSLTVFEGIVLPTTGFMDYNFSHLGGAEASVWTEISAWGGNDKSFRVLGRDPRDQTGRGRAFPVRCMKKHLTK